MAHIITIRNYYCYYNAKSATLDNMDGSDAILCWHLAVDEPPCPTFISMYILCFGGITVITLLSLHH